MIEIKSVLDIVGFPTPILDLLMLYCFDYVKKAKFTILVLSSWLS